MTALWQMGFRPFFALAMLSGMGLPLLWALIYSGVLDLPPTSFTPAQWHAHEMFFGFGWAVLAGFLLTATKNWVGVRGYHGVWLQFLAGAWLLERVGMWLEGSLAQPLFLISNNLFIAAAVAMLGWTLIRNRKTDSYGGDNRYLLVLLPLFLAAKQLLLSADLALLGQSMTIGLFRLAFLIMLERTLSQFMKGLFGVSILRKPWLDMSIKALALAVVFESMLPSILAAGLALLLALLLAVRFAFWKPQLAFTRLDIGIMHLGYLGIVLHLLVMFAIHATAFEPVGSLAVHVFTFGVIGLVTPAMMIRISKGHTGRRVVFERPDKIVLWIMMAAFVFRVVAPQIIPSAFALCVNLSAVCWFAAFGTLAWRYLPFLCRPRADGNPG
ncbi:NnrS family protein [Rhodospirillaceae bacterium LM-1]|nr:NnrS family protein [Rhodospirillaceae bacterium LM-1]